MEEGGGARAQPGLDARRLEGGGGARLLRERQVAAGEGAVVDVVQDGAEVEVAEGEEVVFADERGGDDLDVDGLDDLRRGWCLLDLPQLGQFAWIAVSGLGSCASCQNAYALGLGVGPSLGL